jgi:hypothetical protein
MNELQPVGQEAPQEAAPEGMSEEQHGAHMEQMKAGLQAILQSQDINEAHSIAQSLLGEEQKEQSAEGAPQEGMDGLREKLQAAMAQGGGAE